MFGHFDTFKFPSIESLKTYWDPFDVPKSRKLTTMDSYEDTTLQENKE